MKKKYREPVPSYISSLASPMREIHQDDLIATQATVKYVAQTTLIYFCKPIVNQRLQDQGDSLYNAWEEDIAMVNIFFGEETVMGGIHRKLQIISNTILSLQVLQWS